MQNIIDKILQFKYLFLAIPLILIIVFIIVISIAQRTKNPTPSEIKNQLNIESVSPADKATNIGLYNPIAVTFTRPFAETEKSGVQISLFPEATGKQSWSTDNKTLTLIPTAPFKTGQQYTASINIARNIYSWTFQVVNQDNISQEDGQKLQSQADKDWANRQTQIRTDYPWYDSLPLQADNYFVLFDANSKTFIAALYPKKSNPTTIDQQVVALKAEVTSKLNVLGVSATIPISWEITPEP